MRQEPLIRPFRGPIKGLNLNFITTQSHLSAQLLYFPCSYVSIWSLHSVFSVGAQFVKRRAAPAESCEGHCWVYCLTGKRVEWPVTSTKNGRQSIIWNHADVCAACTGLTSLSWWRRTVHLLDFCVSLPPPLVPTHALISLHLISQAVVSKVTDINSYDHQVSALLINTHLCKPHCVLGKLTSCGCFFVFMRRGDLDVLHGKSP